MKTETFSLLAWSLFSALCSHVLSGEKNIFAFFDSWIQSPQIFCFLLEILLQLRLRFVEHNYLPLCPYSDCLERHFFIKCLLGSNFRKEFKGFQFRNLKKMVCAIQFLFVRLTIDLNGFLDLKGGYRKFFLFFHKSRWA